VNTKRWLLCLELTADGEGTMPTDEQIAAVLANSTAGEALSEATGCEARIWLPHEGGVLGLYLPMGLEPSGFRLPWPDPTSAETCT
jgi:hypothetical protein